MLLDRFFIVSDSRSPFFHLVHIKPNGSRIKISTKAKTKTDALIFLREYKKEVTKQSAAKVITLEQFEVEYLSFISSTHSKNTIRNVALYFKHLLKSLSNEIELVEITSRSIEEIISRLYSKAPQSAASFYRFMSASFNCAVRWGYISENPFSTIRKPKAETKILPAVEYQDLIKILDATSNELLKSIFLFAFFTGLRVSELVNLRVSSINLSEKIIHLKNENGYKTKSKKERIIPVSPAIVSVLKKLIENKSSNDFLFCKIPGIKLREDYCSKGFKKSVRAAGVNPDYSFHGLRRGFGSTLAGNGVPLHLISNLLGHTEIKTTQIYLKFRPVQLVEAVNSLGASYNKTVQADLKFFNMN